MRAMAERRMFAKTIVDSDAFIEMPMSARLLYYDLAMRADDDGFVNAPKKIMKFVGSSDDDMRILISRKFILPFDDGVVVIKHWRIHNYIRKDTYKETTYKEDKALLEFDENGAYRLINEENAEAIEVRQRSVDESSTQVRLGEDRLDKDRLDKDRERSTQNIRFVPPTIDEVKDYCFEKGYKIDAERFIDFYEARGWMMGKNKMKNWKAAVRTWVRSDKENGSSGSGKGKRNTSVERVDDWV